MTTDALESAEPVRDAESHREPEGDGRRDVEAVVAAIYEDAERIKRCEVDEAVRKLEARDDLTDGQRDAVEAMAGAIVDQLLAVPARSLREAAAGDAWSTIDTALGLFDPELGAVGGTAHEGDTVVPEVNDDD